MHVIDAVDVRQGQDQRHDDNDGGEDVHQRADRQQEHVQEQQEHESRVYVRLRPLDELRRDLREYQVVGQGGRNSQDQQDSAYQCDAVGGHAEDVRPRRQVPVDVSLHDHRVECRHRRRLDERGHAADERSDDENRQR